MSYTCSICHDHYHPTEQAANNCCRCEYCGEKTLYKLCEVCYSDRNCEGCFTVYDGENPEDRMFYGCSSEGTVGIICEEDTLCFDCWSDRQPPLLQLAGAAE
jgi:hypothetical protein